MRKYKKQNKQGVWVVSPIKGKKDRPKFPRPAVYRKKTDYDRNRSKRDLRKDIRIDT